MNPEQQQALFENTASVMGDATKKPKSDTSPTD